jgi:hypothetical protein
MRRLVRIVLNAAGLIVAFLAFVNAASGIGALPLAAAAHSGWLGLNGNILSLLAESGFKDEMASEQAEVQQEGIPRLSDHLIATAKASYAVNPLDVASLRTIALGGLLQEDKARARQLMRIAQQISKRDSITDLWLAQDYGQSGNVNAMLASFDHALRIDVRVRQAAMKPFVESLASPASFAPLGKLLDRHPEWEDGFWHELVRNPIGVANAASFLAETGIPLERIPEDERRVLYGNVKQAKQFDTLFRLAALDPGIKASERALAAGQFVTADEGDPLSWTLRSTGAAAARVLPGSSMLEIDAQPGSFGVAADRIVSLRGAQDLAIRLADPLPDNAGLELVLECADDSSTQLADIRLSPGEKDGEASFYSSDCAFGNLRLSFTVDEGRRAAQMRIASITLRPI